MADVSVSGLRVPTDETVPGGNPEYARAPRQTRNRPVAGPGDVLQVRSDDDSETFIMIPIDQIVPQSLMGCPPDHCQSDGGQVFDRRFQRASIGIRRFRRRNVVAPVGRVRKTPFRRRQGDEVFAFELPQQDPAYLPFEVAVFLPPVPQPAELPGNGHTAVSPLSGNNGSDLIQFPCSDLSAANDEIRTYGLASFLPGREQDQSWDGRVFLETRNAPFSRVHYAFLERRLAFSLVL